MEKLRISVTPYKYPTKPGLYVVKWKGTNEVQIIRLFEFEGELHTAGGPRTHYTRWQCAWSEAIEVHNPYE